MKESRELKGVIPVVQTPVHRDGTVDVQILPPPDWTGVANAPTGGELDALNEALDQLEPSAS